MASNGDSLLTPTNFLIAVLFVALIVVTGLVIDLWNRVPKNPLALVPFQASVLNASLIGGLNGETGKSNSLGVKGKETLRFGNKTVDRSGNFICEKQAVYVFTVTLLKGYSWEGVDDQFVIRQNGLILSMQLLPTQATSYTTSLSLFCNVGDQINFEYYTGTLNGKNEKNRDAFTILNEQYSTLNVLILPQQFPTKDNYDAQIPYLQWSS